MTAQEPSAPVGRLDGHDANSRVGSSGQRVGGRPGLVAGLPADERSSIALVPVLPREERERTVDDALDATVVGAGLLPA